MKFENLLKGKTVLFLDTIQGFDRYGKIVGTVRIGLGPIRKANGKIIKRPTVKGYKVKLSTGKIFKIPPDYIKAVRWYGKDIPLAEFVADRI